MLLFKKKFLEAIRCGEKTQTIRIWPHRRLKEGQRSFIPGAGYIRIKKVEQVDLESITDADAQPDGFSTAEELRAEIDRLYPQGTVDGRQAYRVRFALLPPEEQRRSGE